MRKIPIQKCRVCGRPIVRMRKVALKNSNPPQYRLMWSKATYCGSACYQRAYRIRAAAAHYNL